MTDGDVPLDGEGGQGERRGVHGEELGVDHEGASSAAPEPHVTQDVVRENLLNTKRQALARLTNVRTPG